MVSFITKLTMITITKMLIFTIITKIFKISYCYLSTFENLTLLGCYAVLICSYRRFGTTFLYHPHGSNSPKTVWTV